METVNVSPAESMKGAEHPGMGHGLECVGRNLGFQCDLPVPHNSILFLLSLPSFGDQSHVNNNNKKVFMHLEGFLPSLTSKGFIRESSHLVSIHPEASIKHLADVPDEQMRFRQNIQ